MAGLPKLPGLTFSDPTVNGKFSFMHINIYITIILDNKISRTSSIQLLQWL